MWNERAPEGSDPVTKAMFYRGWPLAPFMFCIIYFNRYRPNGGEALVLVFDWLVLIVALYATKAACERLLRWRRHCNLCDRNTNATSCCVSRSGVARI